MYIFLDEGYWGLYVVAGNKLLLLLLLLLICTEIYNLLH